MPFESLEKIVVALVLHAVDCLDSCRPIDMCDCRDSRALIREGRGDEEHVGTLAVEFEVIGYPLFQDSRRKRAKIFPKFYFKIHLLPVLLIAGIGDDRSVSESARTVFHPSLEPSDNILSFKESGDSRDEVLLFKVLIGNMLLIQNCPDVLIGIFPSEEDMLHLGTLGAMKDTVPNCQRNTQSATGISRSRLDKNMIEETCTENMAVGNTVESDTSRETEIF